MDHYLYAQIHGYDYKYYHAQPIEGYYNTWIKPHALAALLEGHDYQFVVFLDADVTATHMDVPLEWLFNHWNITSRTSIAMPYDPLANVWQKPELGPIANSDSKGNTVLNTGFAIVQDLPLTHEMLQAWRDCPTEKRYKDCGHWKLDWSHEQRAFSEYIRYDFNPQGDNIVVRRISFSSGRLVKVLGTDLAPTKSIACDDANAWPGSTEDVPLVQTECNGNFFRHHWGGKEKTRDELQNAVMQLLTQLLQEKVTKNIDKILVQEKEKPEE
jgi:hypothetical protein